MNVLQWKFNIYLYLVYAIVVLMRVAKELHNANRESTSGRFLQELHMGSTSEHKTVVQKVVSLQKLVPTSVH